MDAASPPPAATHPLYVSTSVFFLFFNRQHIPFFLAILKADTPGYAWRNQVALPGGHIDKSDRSPLDAAYRELEEEIGISKDQVRCIGSMGHFQTIQHKDIEVFLGLWDGRIQDIVYDPKEISRVLEIPLALVLESHVAKPFQGRIPGIMELLYPFEDVVIWGVTARILHFFLELLVKRLADAG